MPARESRRLGVVFEKRGKPPVAFEFDEKQHFNDFRARTFELYPRSVRVGFPTEGLDRALQGEAAAPSGAFAVPKPPFFRGEELPAPPARLPGRSR